MALTDELRDAAQALYDARGFGHTIGFGKSPAILVVDMIVGFTDPNSPLGAELAPVVSAIVQLLAIARKKAIPIIFTTVAYDDTEPQPARVFMTKVPSLTQLKVGSPSVEVDERLNRSAGEPLIVKHFASAFFGTNLAPLLVGAGSDTVVVTGCTTSGCVRASVVDALQYGFRPIVPAEAVGDRAKGPHDANLFDIAAKYGDVLPLGDVARYLEHIPGR